VNGCPQSTFSNRPGTCLNCTMLTAICWSEHPQANVAAAAAVCCKILMPPDQRVSIFTFPEGVTRSNFVPSCCSQCRRAEIAVLDSIKDHLLAQGLSALSQALAVFVVGIDDRRARWTRSQPRKKCSWPQVAVHALVVIQMVAREVW